MILHRDLLKYQLARASKRSLRSDYNTASWGQYEDLCQFIDEHKQSDILNLYFQTQQLYDYLNKYHGAIVKARFPKSVWFQESTQPKEIEYRVTSGTDINSLLSKLDELTRKWNAGTMLDIEPFEYNGSIQMLTFNDFILQLEELIQEYFTQKFILVFNSPELAKKLKLEKRQAIDAMNRVNMILTSSDLASLEKMSEILALQDKTINPESYEFFQKVLNNS